MPLLVTAAIILNDQNEVFLARRKKGDRLGEHWELPGGKLEAGERPGACLEREIKEELNIEIKAEKPFNFSYFEYPDLRILLLAYICRYVSGEARAVDCDDFSFFKKETIKNGELKIAPADIALLNELLERGYIS